MSFEMPAGQLDDMVIDSIVAGRPVDARFDRIVAFARQARSLSSGPPPGSTPALRAVFAGRRRRGRCRVPTGRERRRQ